MDSEHGVRQQALWPPGLCGERPQRACETNLIRPGPGGPREIQNSKLEIRNKSENPMIETNHGVPNGRCLRPTAYRCGKRTQLGRQDRHWGFGIGDWGFVAARAPRAKRSQFRAGLKLRRRRAGSGDGCDCKSWVLCSVFSVALW